MFHRWAALVLVLALCAKSPKNAAGQTQSTAPRGHGAGTLGKPYPNPFNPAVSIPFSVVDDDGKCTDGRQLHVVNVRILNILAEPVVVPVLQGPSSSSTTGTTDPLGGTRLSNLKLGCGAYTGYWDGFIPGTTKEAASGMYLVQFFVDGVSQGTKRIFLRK
jgi:hypothetical protein